MFFNTKEYDIDDDINFKKYTFGKQCHFLNGTLQCKRKCPNCHEYYFFKLISGVYENSLWQCESCLNSYKKSVLDAADF